MDGASNSAAAVSAGPLELVVAVAENDVIGRGNQLPWHLPADLRHFKSLTLGKPILMGRRTYEAIGKALPGRTNIVLSRAPNFAPSDCTVVSNLDDARIVAGTAIGPGKPPAEGGAQSALMVIGGAQIYQQCLTLARRIHLTLIHTEINGGDTLFSGWRGPEWQESARERHDADEKNAHAYSFVTLERVADPFVRPRLNRREPRI